MKLVGSMPSAAKLAVLSLLGFWLLLIPFLMMATGTVDHPARGEKAFDALRLYGIVAALTVGVLTWKFTTGDRRFHRLVWVSGSLVALLPLFWIVWVDLSRHF